MCNVTPEWTKSYPSSFAILTNLTLAPLRSVFVYRFYQAHVPAALCEDFVMFSSENTKTRSAEQTTQRRRKNMIKLSNANSYVSGPFPNSCKTRLNILRIVQFAIRYCIKIVFYLT